MRVGRRLGLVVAAGIIVGSASAAYAAKPSDDPWPKGLHGPFPLKSVTEVTITAHDGTKLQAWVGMPDLPRGVRAPAVLQASQYFDWVDPHPGLGFDPGYPVSTPSGTPGVGSTSWWDENPTSVVRTRFGVPPVALVHAGFAVVFAAARGTGGSGGCFDPGSPDEARDQRDTVNWVARQPWSNGRVGMVGFSYPAQLTWEAATQAPPALKAIVTAGDLLDLYQFDHTPNGARSLGMADVFGPSLSAALEHDSGALRPSAGFVSHAGCTTVEQTFGAGLAGSVTGDRDGSRYGPRNMMLKLPRVRAAVLDTQGYLDWAGHGWMGDPIWTSLPASTPKIAYQGQWGHSFPDAENAWHTTFTLPSGTTDWPHILVGYFDHYLKGVGSLRTGVIYHQDQELTWHQSASWPPAPEAEQVLHPVGASLVRSPATNSQSFRAVQSPADLHWAAFVLQEEGAPQPPDGQGVEQSLCSAPLPLPDARTFLSPPAQAPALIAGNPFLSLDVRSDRPGGVVAASLWDLAPSFSCASGTSSGAEMITTGAADLAFVHGGYVARPFPTGRTTPVRIDLFNTTWRVLRGHRLALVVSNGDFGDRTFTDVPTVDVVGTSDVVLPVMEGTLGGTLRTDKAYPPRPFVPPSYRD